MLTPNQLRAARGLIGWSRAKLATKAGVSVPAITSIELGTSDPKISTLQKLRSALQAAGVVFVDADEHAGPGVRMRKAKR